MSRRLPARGGGSEKRPCRPGFSSTTRRDRTEGPNVGPINGNDIADDSPGLAKHPNGRRRSALSTLVSCSSRSTSRTAPCARETPPRPAAVEAFRCASRADRGAPPGCHTPGAPSPPNSLHTVGVRARLTMTPRRASFCVSALTCASRGLCAGETRQNRCTRQGGRQSRHVRAAFLSPDSSDDRVRAVERTPCVWEVAIDVLHELVDELTMQGREVLLGSRRPEDRSGRLSEPRTWW